MTEPAAGSSGPGTVVLELGPGIGALILYTPADLDGEEIEISGDVEPGDPGSRRTHSRVRPRHMPGETRYAAVYPSLPAGRYTVWRDEHSLAATVMVTGGQVSSCHWPR
jgi:hypothetical protein